MDDVYAEKLDPLFKQWESLYLLWSGPVDKVATYSSLDKYLLKSLAQYTWIEAKEIGRGEVMALAHVVDEWDAHWRAFPPIAGIEALDKIDMGLIYDLAGFFWSEALTDSNT